MTVPDHDGTADGGVIFQRRPGESHDEFFARLLAASGPPTPEELDRLRQLIPLRRTTRAADDAA